MGALVRIAHSEESDVPSTRSGRRSRLTDEAKRLLVRSVPEETLNAYKREWPKFLAYCERLDESALPAHSDTVTNWVASRTVAEHSVSIIKQGISAVMFFHDQLEDENGFKIPKSMWPDTSDAWRIVRRYKQDLLDGGWRPDQAAVFTVDELRAMCAALPDRRVVGLRNRAILTIGTTLFARRSNLVRLDIEDMSLTDTGVDVYLSRSKTDQWGRGRTVDVLPGTHRLSDPVGALRAWLRMLHSQGITSGPLFREATKAGTYGKILDKRLEGYYVGVILRRAAVAAGIEPPPGQRFRAHSLRASGATMAFEAGAPTALVAERGGWSVRGNQVQVYNRPRGKDNAMRGVL